VHYQFETIHPFRDGNGRIGRLLVLLLMIRDGAIPSPLLPLSPAFERRRTEYADLLLAVSTDNQWLPWVRFFLEGVVESADAALQQVAGLTDLRERWHARFHEARSSALLLKLIDRLFVQPAITLSQTAELLHVSPASASANIAKLEEEGILTEVTGRVRQRIYVARDVLRFIDSRVPLK
jgi:Fic family protein